MPIGKGGFQPVQAGDNNGGFFKKVNSVVNGIFKANQQKQWFDYTQDRKDESTVKRFALEATKNHMGRQQEFDLAHKWVTTHGSDYVQDPKSGKRTRVTRKGVTAGRYNTGQADSTGETYGDKLIKNTELKKEISSATLEARRLAAERSAGNSKKTTTKKTSAGKPRVKKVTATKETNAGIAVDSTGAATPIGKDGKMPPKRTGNVKKTSTGGGLTEIRNSTVETGSGGSKTTKAPKTTGTTNNPALTKMKNSGKAVF